MLSAALFLLANSLFLTLRLTGDTGSFPKPLSAGEERMYLERSLAGDLEARNILVEHNLRLVAHIIKKYYTQAAEQEDLHRHHRAYEGRGYLPPGAKDPPGYLRLPLCGE